MLAPPSTLSSLLPMLLRRKWVLLGSALAGAAVAVSLSGAVPHQYDAHGELVVDTDQPTVPELGIGSARTTVDDSNPVATQIDVVRSTGLLSRVVRDLHLTTAQGLVPKAHLPGPVAATISAVHGLFASGPGTAPTDAEKVAATAGYLSAHLKAEAKEHSRVMSLSFLAATPGMAAEVVNALMHRYLADEIASRAAQSTQINRWLTERAQEIHNEAAAAQDRVKLFLRSHNAQQVQGSSAIALQLSKDQESLTGARQALDRYQASFDAIASKGGAAAAPEVLASRTIQQLKDREAEVLVKMAPFASTDPRRRMMQQGLDGIRDAIRQETNRIVAGLKQNIAIAGALVAQLKSAVATDTVEAREASASDVSLATLKQDAEARQKLYQAFLARAEETRMAAAQLPSARILSPATPPERPTVGRGFIVAVAAVLGLLAGALIAAGAILSRGLLSSRIVSRDDIGAVTGLPVFGCLPDVPKRAGAELPTLVLDGGASAVPETLRAMWLAIQSVPSAGGGIVTVITSSEIGEGKTTVAASLARRTAADGVRVLLIDADLRRPNLSRVLGLTAPLSLESVLCGEASLEQAVVRDSRSGLDCLLARGHAANPLALLASRAFKDLLAHSRVNYDLVIIDTPPVLRVADPVLIAREAQVTMFLIRSGHTEAELVEEAVRRFPPQERDKILSVLTRVPPGHLGRTDYYSGYRAPAGRKNLTGLATTATQ